MCQGGANSHSGVRASVYHFLDQDTLLVFVLHQPAWLCQDTGWISLVEFIATPWMVLSLTSPVLVVCAAWNGLTMKSPLPLPATDHDSMSPAGLLLESVMIDELLVDILAGCHSMQLLWPNYLLRPVEWNAYNPPNSNFCHTIRHSIVHWPHLGWGGAWRPNLDLCWFQLLKSFHSDCGWAICIKKYEWFITFILRFFIFEILLICAVLFKPSIHHLTHHPSNGRWVHGVNTLYCQMVYIIC